MKQNSIFLSVTLLQKNQIIKTNKLPKISIYQKYQSTKTNKLPKISIYQNE